MQRIKGILWIGITPVPQSVKALAFCYATAAPNGYALFSIQLEIFN
jgi:stage V sporulation protein SpoVS